jgi:hypothetical protein
MRRLAWLLLVLAPLAYAKDGQHDFDWEIGKWKTSMRVRLHPLSGSNEWKELEGTSTVTPLAGGRANIVELVADGGGLHIEGVSVRLYHPDAQQWALHYANLRDGLLTTPVTGGFKDGRGEFYGPDTLNGRAIFVRFIVTQLTPESWHFEQSFSDDGGKTWETNWIATDTKMK